MDPEQLAENRRQLARLARTKGKRRVPRGEFPCEWWQGTVINPEDNQPFTDAGAWEFCAQLLENIEEQEVTLRTLERPAGRVAFVMKHVLPGGALYVKVHFGHGPTILGRSFHYSDYYNQP
jgi:hypothetical protein